jgi:hypothetical protein
MRSALKLVAAVALGAGIGGGGIHPTSYAPITIDLVGAAGGEVVTTVLTERAGTVQTLHLEVFAAGTGAGDYTVEVAAEGVVVCSVAIPCATAPGPINTDCGGDSFSAGDDLHVDLASTGCSADPVVRGSLGLITR